MATGATPIRPDLAGIDGEGIFSVHTLDEGGAIRRYVEQHLPTRAVVVGGGYISLEMAEALGALGIDTHLVEIAPQPMGTLDPDMGALVAEGLREFGITLHLGTGVTGFETHNGVVTAVRTAAGPVTADLVLLGLGVRPNTALAETAGLAIGESRAVVVDDHQRTSVEGVWSAGDCCEKFHRVSRRPVAIALGTHANKQGRVAGVNIGGGDAVFPGVVGTAVTKVCALEVARTGLTEADAAAAGFATESFTSHAEHRGVLPRRRADHHQARRRGGHGPAARWPDRGSRGSGETDRRARDCVVERHDGRRAAERGPVVPPPYSPVWDPILAAARQAASGRRD